MSYVDSSLLTNEVVIYQGRVSWWSAFWPIFWGIFLGIFTIIGFLVMVPAIFRIMTTEIAITDKRIILKTGFISREVLELRLRQVEGITVNRSITGRILGFGDITVRGYSSIMTVKGIATPEQYRRKFFESEDAIVEKVRIVS